MNYFLQICRLKTCTALVITLGSALCFFISAGIITRDFATGRTVQEITLEEGLSISKIQLCFEAPTACFKTQLEELVQEEVSENEIPKYVNKYPQIVEKCHHTFIPNGVDENGIAYEKLFMGYNQVDRSYLCRKIDRLGSEERAYAMTKDTAPLITDEMFVLRSKTHNDSRGIEASAFLIGLYYTEHNYLQDPDKHFIMIGQHFKTNDGLPNEIVIQLSARKFEPIDRSDCLAGPELAPSGFARTVCEAECKDEVMLSKGLCKLFPEYSGIGWNRDHTTDICTPDDIQKTEIKPGFETQISECMGKKGCETQRYCEEWQISSHVTHNSLGDPYKLTKQLETSGLEGTRETVIKVYVEKPFITVRDVYETDFVAWMVALGGFLGLWLGLGCLNLSLYVHEIAFSANEKRKK